ncbi:MAG: hypothetical protein AMK73_10265 [Planctomycetes bacterium SM23_32]|nr:MAG: hypothetical protein AMK73_10265 [Planctomycetes bacterium SM23_32]
MTRSPSVARLTRKHALFVVTLAAAVLAFLGPMGSYDVWWHLKTGRLILQTGRVPHTDPFSFTAAGHPWTHHSWLADLALTGAYQAGGTAGLIAVRAGAIAASLMLAWLAARRRGVSAGLASVLVIGAALQLKVRALARPYVFSFVLFMLFALIVQGCRRSPPSGSPEGRRRSGEERWLAAEDSFLWGGAGRLLLLPLLMVLWANVHAGFVSGLLLIGAFGAGEVAETAARKGLRRCPGELLRGPDGARFRAMVVAGVLCLAASVVTPGGPATLLYPFQLLRGVKLVKRILEWQPVPFRTQFGVFWALLPLGGVIMLRSLWLSARSGRLRGEAGQFVTDTLLMAGFAVLAVQAARHMAWFLLLAPSVLGWHLAAARRACADDGPPSVPEERPLYAVVACVLAFFVGVWPSVKGGPPSFGTVRDKFPERACDFVAREGLTRYRLYNSYEWGGFLIWRFWPELRVFIDGRCLVYGDDIIGQAIAVEQGAEGWKDVLERWQVEMLLVRYHKRDSSHLFADGRWRCVYWDDAAVIGLRADAAATRRPPLAEFPLSNPVTFEESLGREDPRDVLEELDAVLARHPKCWTALAFKARCLVRQAERQTEERHELLERASVLASRARELQDARYDPWLAVEEVARALGQGEVAERAARKAAALRE